MDVRKDIASAYMIGLAYSATIGGMSTLVGTPTNILLAGFWDENFPQMESISFIRWSKFGVPFSLLLLTVLFIILKKMFIKHPRAIVIDKSFIRNKYASLGKITFEQLTVVIVFSITSFLWLTRAGFDFGKFEIPGWGRLFQKGFMLDSTVAILVPILLFFIPSKNIKQSFVLEWQDMKPLPINILFLFGGGFALAKGIEVSGLGDFIANQLQFLKAYPVWIILTIVAIIVTVFSELASNVASITLMLPILSSLASAIDINPVLLLMTAAFACSNGFMLHVATPPNTIAYGSGYVTTQQLLRTGLIMNIISIIFLTLFLMLFGF